jgi:very-short-patch-repair endonuclease
MKAQIAATKTQDLPVIPSRAGKRRRRVRTPVWELKGQTPALVAVISRKKDWEILLDRHWYRVPVRTAPERLERARYIAWYQTSAFGDEKWAVNRYARVERVIALRRIDLLPDEAGHPRAREVYFRVDVGDVLRLPHPVPSRRWRRIVFIPTTLERLFLAREVNDLYDTSPIEDRLYFALRDAGLAPERQFLVRDEKPGQMLDLALFCRDGRVGVECDGESYHSGKDKAEQDRHKDNSVNAAGWHLLRFSGREINNRTGECVATVKRTVRRLGGELASEGKSQNAEH